MLCLWCFAGVAGICLLLSVVDRLSGRHAVFRLDKAISSDLTVLDSAISEITAALVQTEGWGGAESDVDIIDLVLREALANAVVHGNKCNPQITVHISVILTEGRELLVSIKDSGLGFDPDRPPDSVAEENVFAPHGRGIFLIRQLMDEVDFRFDQGTEVRMRLRRK
jgi:anti-sigma regulatory factor (Ser/Thr protein kinase)